MDVKYFWLILDYVGVIDIPCPLWILVRPPRHHKYQLWVDSTELSTHNAPGSASITAVQSIVAT